MAFAQLTYRESLRDIETCRSAQAAKLYAAYSGEDDQPFRLIVITESGDRDHAQGGPKCPGRDGRRSAPPT